MALLWMFILLLLGSSQGKAKLFMSNHFKQLAPSFLSALHPDVEDKKGLEESLEDETDAMIKSVQGENMKPLQGSWYWNPLNMTFIWSIQRPIGGSDRYTLAFKHEGVEFDKAEGFENSGELEEKELKNLENLVLGSEAEEVLGSPTGIH